MRCEGWGFDALLSVVVYQSEACQSPLIENDFIR